jgi:hypothetical protein
VDNQEHVRPNADELAAIPETIVGGTIVQKGDFEGVKPATDQDVLAAKRMIEHRNAAAKIDGPSMHSVPGPDLVERLLARLDAAEQDAESSKEALRLLNERLFHERGAVLDTVRKQAEKIAAAEARAKELEQSREWQPIEAMPAELADGRDVLLLREDESTEICYFDAGKWWTSDHDHMRGAMYFFPIPPVATGTKEDRT